MTYGIGLLGLAFAVAGYAYLVLVVAALLAHPTADARRRRPGVTAVRRRDEAG